MDVGHLEFYQAPGAASLRWSIYGRIYFRVYPGEAGSVAGGAACAEGGALF